MNMKLFSGLLLCLMLCSIPRAQATFSVASRHRSSLEFFSLVTPVNTIKRYPDPGFEEIRDGQLSSEEVTEESTILSLRGGGVFSSLESYFTASKTRCWGVLLVSILTDTVSTTMIKVARDEKSMIKLAGAFGGYFLSLFGFALSLAHLDVGIAYAVWAALGTALVSAAGIALFGESCDALKLTSLLMIVLGVVGLNLSDGH